jgi:hypothetical protein
MSWSWKTGLAGLAILAASAYAVAQMPDPSGMHDRMMSGQMPQGMQETHRQMGSHGPMMGMMPGRPAMPGQAAFGTIQEVVRILEADPTTDWAKVNISALREHLIDMDELTMRAVATERALDNGIEIAVTGTGRTRDAINRMIPAHVQELNATGWNAKAEDLPDGEKLTVTSTDAKQVTKLKALGFMGIMVQGAHHQAHHLMIAKGEFAH